MFFYIRRLKRKLSLYRFRRLLRKRIEVEHRWYGSDYGGFYLVPHLLDSEAIIYSFGVGEDIAFDEQIINAHGCNVFGFDPTPTSIVWYNGLCEKPTGFVFMEYGLSHHTGSTKFYLPRNKEHISGSIIAHTETDSKYIEVDMKCFSDITNQLKHSTIDVLKMDIEGAEYAVLEDILRLDIFIKQIVIEFHHRFLHDGVKQTRQAIQKLLRKDYKIFAASDRMEEISFVHINALK